jgi:Uncharacterized protein conserved in bacteria (DUF2188)
MDLEEAPMPRRVYFVLKSNGGWRVYEGDGRRSTHETEEDAIDFATSLARSNQPSQVRIQKHDGTWVEERTFGDDLYPPPG